MADKILISIIVPVYNVSRYLEECLQSLVRQTFQDIEIICIDDCSTDGSWEILQRFAGQDHRISLTQLSRNSSACVARAEGVEKSRGKYIIFVDPDDYLSVNACEELYSRMEKAKCDILHFVTEVVGEDAKSVRGTNLTQMINPHEKSVKGDLVSACFLQQKFGFQLWNKIYRGEVVRRAMKNSPKEYLPKAQDLLAFFLIASEAGTYRSQQTEPMYYYRMGVGVTGGKFLTRDQLEKNAMQLRIPEKIREILKNNGKKDQYQKAVNRIEENLITDSLSKLISYTYQEDKAYGWEILCQYAPREKLLGCLAKEYYTHEEQIIDICEIFIRRSTRVSELKTIGTFYPRLKNGGAQRVICDLVKIWKKMGYRLVVITEERTEEEYELPEGVKRYCLPKFAGLDENKKREGSAVRITELGRIVREEKIDLFVYHQWLNDFSLWDLLTVKTNGALFCIHCHSVFSVPLVEMNMLHSYRIMPDVYRLADGVFTLSDVDQYYWRQYNPKSFMVVNPLPFEKSRTAPRELQNHRILWVGRLSKEKRPFDVLNIMQRVKAEIPDAKLIMVGGNNPEMEEELRKNIAEYDLENNIVLAGFQKDVSPYYKDASLYLSTSEYEGFAISIAEAQINGLPVVGYDLFYLSILKERKGCMLAPVGRTDRLAEMIIRILKDPEEYRRQSAEAIDNIRSFNIDLEDLWKNVFTGIISEEVTDGQDTGGKLALDTIRQHVTLRSDLDIVNGRNMSDMALAVAFPSPKKGPAKGLRRKAALLSRVLLIDGFSGVAQRLKEKGANAEGEDPDAV